MRQFYPMIPVALLAVNGCVLLEVLQGWDSAEHINYPSNSEIGPFEFFMICNDDISEPFQKICDHPTKFETDITGNVSHVSIASNSGTMYFY